MAPNRKITEASNTKATTKATLIRKLIAANISFEGCSLKPAIQATYALYEVGYLKPGMSAPKTLIDTIAEWFVMTALDLMNEVKKRRLNEDNRPCFMSKHQCFNFLLKDAISKLQHGQDEQELEIASNDDEEKTAEGLANLSIQKSESEASLDGTPKEILELASAIESNVQVVDLLLSSALAAANRSNETRDYDNMKDKLTEPFATISSDDFKTANFPNLETLVSRREIISSLSGMNIKCRDLISHIISEFSHTLIHAKSELRMPGFPASVSQFLVIRTPKDISEKIGQAKANKTKRMVLFHGTDLSFLPRILLEGLKATSTDGGVKYHRALWMAMEPATSYYYARQWIRSQSLSWSHNMYPKCGVLLGCEFLDEREHDEDYEDEDSVFKNPKIGRPQPVHIFGPDDTTRIVVRYVFVIPKCILSKYKNAPEAANLQPLMLEAFKSKTFQGV